MHANSHYKTTTIWSFCRMQSLCAPFYSYFVFCCCSVFIIFMFLTFLSVLWCLFLSTSFIFNRSSLRIYISFWTALHQRQMQSGVNTKLDSLHTKNKWAFHGLLFVLLLLLLLLLISVLLNHSINVVFAAAPAAVFRIINNYFVHIIENRETKPSKTREREIHCSVVLILSILINCPIRLVWCIFNNVAKDFKQ